MTNELFELWMPVKGYEGLYEVSDLGRIKRLERYVINEYGNEEILEERILNTRQSPSTETAHKIGLADIAS